MRGRKMFELTERINKIHYFTMTRLIEDLASSLQFILKVVNYYISNNTTCCEIILSKMILTFQIFNFMNINKGEFNLYYSFDSIR